MIEHAYEAPTRESYDRVAADYAALVGERFGEEPLMRAMLGAFAELVLRDGGGPVVDAGCGPGQITAHLAVLGVDASGVDLSPGMIEIARASYPAVRFAVGSMTALDLPDASQAGVLAWYSTIHVPDELLPVAFAEFARVLRPGGHVLLGFHVGAAVNHKTSGYGGHPMSIDVHLRTPMLMDGLLLAAGLEPVAHLTQPPPAGSSVPQCFLLARKTARK